MRPSSRRWTTTSSSGSLVDEQKKREVEVDQVGDRVERGLRQRVRRGLRDHVAQLRRLAPGLGPVARLVRQCGERPLEHARLVALRDAGVDHAADLAPQPVDDLVGRLQCVPAGGVRRERAPVQQHGGVRRPPRPRRARVGLPEREPRPQQRRVGEARELRHPLARPLDDLLREVPGRGDLDRRRGGGGHRTAQRSSSAGTVAITTRRRRTPTTAGAPVGVVPASPVSASLRVASGARS